MSKKMQLSEHDKQVIKEFVLWMCDKYEVFEPEEDGYMLYGDLKYHDSDELLKEYFNESNEATLEKEDATYEM